MATAKRRAAVTRESVDHVRDLLDQAKSEADLGNARRACEAIQAAQDEMDQWLDEPLPREKAG